MKVYATASSDNKLDYIRSLGATALPYHTFEDILKRDTLPDFILESVGGNVHKRSVKLMAPLGRIVSIGASGIKISKWSPLSWYRAWKDYPRISRKELESQGYMTLHIGFLMEDHRDKIRPIWDRMIAFMQERKLRPLLQDNCVYPMSQVGKVHEMIDTRKNIGRLLLDPHK
jgi:NADPH2:quinone reductase